MKTGLKQKHATNAEKQVYKDLLVQDKPLEAIAVMKKLYLRYPNDREVIFDLASHYVRENLNASEGVFLFSKVINEKNKYQIYYEKGLYYLSVQDFEAARQEFKKMLDGPELYQFKALVNIIKTYIRLEFFGEDIAYYQELKRISEKYGYEIPYAHELLFFLKYNYNLYSNEELETYKDNYYCAMTMEYNPDTVIEHIKERNTDEYFFLNSNRQSKFYDSVDIADLYNYCKNAIKNMKPCNYGVNGDCYLVQLDHEIGMSVDGNPSKSVLVITLPDSINTNNKDIITMYPFHSRFVNRRFEDNFTAFKALALKQNKKKRERISEELPFEI